MIIIKKGTISDLENAPNCAELMQEYAAESALSGLPAPVTDLEKYKVLEEKDLFHAIGAWLDELLRASWHNSWRNGPGERWCLQRDQLHGVWNSDERQHGVFDYSACDRDRRTGDSDLHGSHGGYSADERNGGGGNEFDSCEGRPCASDGYY